MIRSALVSSTLVLALFLAACGGGGGGGAPTATPLTVTTTTPASGAAAVPITTTAITATFDRAVDTSTVTDTTFTVKAGATPVPGTVTSSGTSATFTPSAVLSASTVYTATVTTGVKDPAGTPLAGNYNWTFTTTSNASRPTVLSTVPANAATGVAATTATITINFSEAMDPASITPATITVKDNAGNPLAGTITLTSPTVATFTPSGYLAYSATYTITVTTGVTNEAGNTMAATYTGTFATLPGFGSWLPTAVTGAPHMSGHSAVWTGTEMIVFDGAGGARYNPATDSWALIADFASATQLPPRVGYTAIWTGTAMIIWGGYDPVARAAVNSGAVFTPGAAGTPGTWAELTPPPANFAGRYNHTAVWTGSEMIIWGGFDPGTGTFFNDVARFSPNDNGWFGVNNVGAPSARRGHAAVWTGTQMIVWGGVSAAGAFLNDGAVFTSPGVGVAGNGTWSPVSTTGAPAPAAAGPFNAVWSTTTNEMLIWGGPSFSGRYNPAGNTWAPITSNSATPPVVGTAVWTGSLMLVWGNGIGGRYNPALDTWTAVASAGAPSQRIGHSAVWSGTEMIVFGGAGAPGLTILNSGGRYTP